MVVGSQRPTACPERKSNGFNVELKRRNGIRRSDQGITNPGTVVGTVVPFAFCCDGSGEPKNLAGAPMLRRICRRWEQNRV